MKTCAMMADFCLVGSITQMVCLHVYIVMIVDLGLLLALHEAIVQLSRPKVGIVLALTHRCVDLTSHM